MLMVPNARVISEAVPLAPDMLPRTNVLDSTTDTPPKLRVPSAPPPNPVPVLLSPMVRESRLAWKVPALALISAMLRPLVATF